MANPKQHKKIKIVVSDLLLSVASIVLGAILLIFPGATVAVVMNGIGIAAIIIGIINIVRYFMTDASAAMQSNNLASGLIFVLAGLVVILFHESLIALLPLCIGLAIMIGGFFKLQGSIAALRMGAKWNITMVAAVISLIFGALIVFNPFSTAMTLMRVLGAGLIYEGVVDYTYSKFRKKQKEDIIETTATDL